MTYRVAVALGSNQGDRLAIMRQAMAELGHVGEIEAVSSLYETAPVGGPEQGPYLNAVCVVTTRLAPHRLLSELQQLEAEAGRVRTERWGPRLLDLDLISAVDETGAPIHIETDELVLPHPRARLRRFVLEPLAEVWPGAPTGAGTTARDGLESVKGQAVEGLGRDWVAPRLVTARVLLATQALLLAGYGTAVLLTGRRPVRLTPATVGGGVLVLAGSGVVLWGSAALGPGLSPYPEPRPGTQLVSEGPYRLLRHPIYAGLVVCLAGVATAVRSWPGVAASAVVGSFFWLKARYEESRLRVAVPGYAAYQRRVRGRMIPRTKAYFKSVSVLR